MDGWYPLAYNDDLGVSVKFTDGGGQAWILDADSLWVRRHASGGDPLGRIRSQPLNVSTRSFDGKKSGSVGKRRSW